MLRLVSALGLAFLLSLFATTAAEAMTVREFLSIADRLPQNATAALRPDGRRLINEVSTSVHAVKNAQFADERAGRQPDYCIPARGTGITPEALIARFRALPQNRRDITVQQAIREWMIERWPCGG
ncbi:hypothetical protein [Brevundimonas sp. GCM10030266]|uniref:hypothetical protein n=1 Tax=Brevundimonas sp. GCM10030266 TaxID=3273386 RepID=UPI00361D2D00